MLKTKSGLAVLLICTLLGFGLVPSVQLPADPVHAETLEPVLWPHIYLTGQIAGLDWPLYAIHAGDGSDRLFVVEKAGRIRIVQGGALLPTPFLDITDRVRSVGYEQGLLSVAFPPDYATQGHFYVDYTDLLSDTVVSRFQVTADPNIAAPASEEVVLQVEQPYDNHNGGQLAFGPHDAYLYVGLGDGGSGGDPLGNGQNPATLLGKVLRIDVESGAPLTYTVPATNPYTQTVGYRPEIWALGLRNPWRFAFDPASGDLYIGDVGQGKYEEVDAQPASSPGGENYGWSIMEGLHCYNAATCDATGLTLPVVEYPHQQEGNQRDCSVTGGFVYRGTEYPALDGIYVYGDYCSGKIWGLVHDGATWQNRLLLDTQLRITSFGQDEAGNVWVVDFDASPAGAIQRIAAARLIYLPAILKN